MAILLCPLHVPKRDTSYVLNGSHAQVLLCKSCDLRPRTERFKGCCLCRTESRVFRTPILFGSCRRFKVMGRVTVNLGKEAMPEDITKESYKTTESKFKSLLCVKYSTVNHVITKYVPLALYLIFT
jgi:hypothetical protein